MSEPTTRGTGIQRLMQLAKPEWRRLVLGTVFLALGSGMTLLFPQAMRVIVDGALAHKNAALVDKAALGLIVVFLLQAVGFGARFYLFSSTGERVVSRLRADLFNSLVHQEIAFFDERRTGELTTAGQPAVMVVSTEIRLPLKRFFESSFPRLVVLAFQELPTATEIENAGIVTFPPHLAPAELTAKAAA